MRDFQRRKTESKEHKNNGNEKSYERSSMNCEIQIELQKEEDQIGTKKIIYRKKYRKKNIKQIQHRQTKMQIDRDGSQERRKETQRKRKTQRKRLKKKTGKIIYRKEK